MAIKTSKSNERYFSTAKAFGTAVANRRKKLTKLLKEFPNNLQIAEALKNIKYRRSTPKTKNTTVPKEKVAAVGKPTPNKISFAIKHRAHNGQGKLLWQGTAGVVWE